MVQISNERRDQEGGFASDVDRFQFFLIKSQGETNVDVQANVSFLSFGVIMLASSRRDHVK